VHGLDEAIDLAARSGSMLRLMHVVGASKYLRGDGGSAELIACMPETAGQVLRLGRARAQAAGIAAEQAVT